MGVLAISGERSVEHLYAWASWQEKKKLEYTVKVYLYAWQKREREEISKK